MPGPLTTQASLSKRRASRRPSSNVQQAAAAAGGAGAGAAAAKEVPWDLFDRLLVPLVCCHAAAVLVAFVLNVLRISQVSAFALFIWFALLLVGSILFYHNLKVSAPGKVILLTGCESPLAWLLARKLDDIGFHVFAGFTRRAGNEDADQLKEECSGRLTILQLDVTSERQMLEASLYISEHLPEGSRGIWALVHCATWMALGELEWVPFQVLRKSVDINLLGAARLTQIMLPLIRRTSGRIVFLSSALARIPAPVRGAQCATQAGLEGLAVCLRQEVRSRGVDVSVVAAGEFAAGTAWLSDASMLEQAKIMWAQLSDEQKDTYGEEYFEAALRTLDKYTKTDADLTPTLRALMDAVTRTFPLPRYTPVTRAEKVQTLVADLCPRSIYEAIYSK